MLRLANGPAAIPLLLLEPRRQPAAMHQRLL